MSNTEDLAGCMLMFRQDMIDAGVIDANVAPMFMTEAILGAIQKAALKEQEACALACDKLSNEYLSRSPRKQHSHGAGLGASMCAEAIRARRTK